MAFAQCFQYLNAKFWRVCDKTLLQIQVKDDINKYLTIVESGNVDLVLEQAFNTPGIVTVVSKTPVQSKLVPRNPVGLVCVQNIKFNVPELPLRLITIPTDSTYILQTVVKHWFGNHIGTWNGNAYTAILTDSLPFGKSSSQPICIEMVKLLNLSSDFTIINKSLDAVHATFLTKKNQEWWSLYLLLLNRYIDQQFKRPLLPFIEHDLLTFVEHELMQSSVNCDSETPLCEICLDHKLDVGVILGQNKYVSSMLTCFECFASTPDGIRDNVSKTCSIWLPLFNSLLGLVLLRKAGSDIKTMKNVILHLLNRQSLNQKELYITEYLLRAFYVFHVGLNDDITIDLYKVITNDPDVVCSNELYVERATITNGTLKERLAFAYSPPCK